MNIEIKRLSADMAEDYTVFFENRGFHENDINRGCYCVWHHWTDEHEKARADLPEEERPLVKKRFAAELIRAGKLNGFAAFADDKMVGFCNADLKENYFRLSQERDPESWAGLSGGEKIMAIVCYVVDVDLRGRGIAGALLDAVCGYAEENGFDYVEAYPSKGEFSAEFCGGPLSMYEKRGFDTNGVCRKKL